jgi:hypothetical protein
MANIDWSSLWKKEDWLAVWIGFLILLLVASKVITSIPWNFPKGWIPF